MKKHVLDLFKQHESLTEIKTSENTKYVLIHNLVLEIYFDSISDIAILQKATVESTSGYYYDILKPKCRQSDVDFKSLLIKFLNLGITTDDLIEVED